MECPWSRHSLALPSDLEKGVAGMALKADVTDGVKRTLKTHLKVRDGKKVPEKEDLAFLNGGGAVQLDAAYAYADMADSSGLAQKIKPEVAANVMRAYVHAAARIFRFYGGEIRSFDGDRVMAIFVGELKNSWAVRAALALNWAVEQLLNPSMIELWPDFPQYWHLDHAIGVAAGQALIVRGGVFGDSDMISVGGAPNIAAKLSDERRTSNGPKYATYITEEVYKDLVDGVRYGTEAPTSTAIYYQLAGLPKDEPRLVDMWAPVGYRTIGGTTVSIRASSWWWEPD